MKILVVSDIHYSLRQYDWLANVAGNYDLVVVAGDLLQLHGVVDMDTQAAVIGQYSKRICSKAPLILCSGNHDLIEELDGSRTPEWLQEFDVPGLTVDCESYETQEVRLLSLPWWETEEERLVAEARLAAWQDPDDERLTLWVHHSPAKGTKTSWNGKADHGDQNLSNWVEQYQPDVVLSGHVHNAPYYPGGSWIDHIGKTVLVNGGRQTGDVPATVEIIIENGSLIWCGMEGCVETSLEEAIAS
tara:strand:- start:297 stop:1031 length:735 start_codon:yes stop_codon:yes gene_type:complete